VLEGIRDREGTGRMRRGKSRELSGGTVRKTYLYVSPQPLVEMMTPVFSAFRIGPSSQMFPHHQAFPSSQMFPPSSSSYPCHRYSSKPTPYWCYLR
jgi:hypothetical protein